MSSSDADSPIDAQLVQLLSLCDVILYKQCDPGREPPQIQAIQLAEQLSAQLANTCGQWPNYRAAFQQRIDGLYHLLNHPKEEICPVQDCHLAHWLCEPAEHYLILLALLQDLQTKCWHSPTAAD